MKMQPNRDIRDKKAQSALQGFIMPHFPVHYIHLQIPVPECDKNGIQSGFQSTNGKYFVP